MNAAVAILPQELLRARIARAARAAQRAESRDAEREAAMYWRWTRWAAMLILSMRGNSQSWIGMQLRMDRTSVTYGIAMARQMAADNPEFYDLLDSMIAEAGPYLDRSDLPPSPTGDVRNWRSILQAIAATRNLTLGELIAHEKYRLLVDTRHLCMAVLVARGNSRAQVARWMNRDHSTVISALERFAWLVERPGGEEYLAEFRQYAPDGVEPAHLARVRKK